MKKSFIILLILAVMGVGKAQIVVDKATVIGQIKPMNGVNNGPLSPTMKGNVQGRNNTEAYAAAKFPFVRTHDASIFYCYGGEHVVDITAIFPDFSKDPKEPASYDFTITDWYLNAIREVGGKPFFRLGQKIENHIKKYNVFPPKDFKKWAVVCEHIIRHYNEGWADGHHWNIRYWEIWNEPDLDVDSWQTAPRNWGGTPEQYYDFYTVVSKHLRKCFPSIKIGGPAWAGKREWGDKFLAHVAKTKAPMDFFSWHAYSASPEVMVAHAEHIESLFKKHGLKDVESILDEWNYIKSWSDKFEYSLQVMWKEKGAAYVAATMQACQNSPIDILMYYDASPGHEFTGIFDHPTLKPTKTYYSFYAWSRLAEYGTQVKATSKDKDLYVTATRGTNGKLRILVTRYNDDNNVVTPKRVKIATGEGRSGMVMAHITDSYRCFTEVPLTMHDGNIEVTMEPNAVVVIDLE